MSVFIYNGVTINNADIKTIACEAIYDQADASVMFTRMVYRVQGVVATDQTYSMAQNLVYMRQVLLVPHRGVLIQVGDDVLNIGGGGTTDSYDDVGGPKPRRVDFTEIIGTAFAFVTFELEIGIQEGCPTTGSVISHTYTVSHSLDSRFYITRDVHGVIRVRQTAAAPYNNADALRNLGVPDLPDGFQRKSMTFLLSADGLTLTYTIQDKEVFRVAPLSATEARATFSQQMSNYIWYSHFTMELKGNKNQDQLSMFNDIFTVAKARVNFDDPTLFIQQASIEEDLYDNVVRFQITVMNAVNKSDTPMRPANSLMFTGVPGNDANQNAQLGPYGSAMLMAVKTAFFSPCVNAPEFGFGEQSAGDDTTGNGTGSDGSSGDAPASDTGGIISAAQKSNPYTQWSQTIEYEQHNGIVMIPSSGNGLAGRVYQIHSPYMTITQYGKAVRVGKPVDAPIPQMYDSFNGLVKTKKFTPLAPVPMPDKTTLSFGASWHYEIVVPFNDDDLQSAALDGKTIYDTSVGTSAHPYPLPSNKAITFDPTTNRQTLPASVSYNQADTTPPPTTG